MFVVLSFSKGMRLLVLGILYCRWVMPINKLFIWKVVGASIWLVCFSLLVVQTLNTIHSFLMKKTIKTEEEQWLKDPFTFPSVAICHRKAFKNPHKIMLTVEDYLDNTYNLSEHIIQIRSEFLNSSLNWKREEIYTLVYGRCVYLGTNKIVCFQSKIALFEF